MAQEKTVEQAYIEVEGLRFPRLWKNKKNGKTARVMPWYEIPEPVLDESAWRELTGMKDVKAKYGVLVRVGWLVETEQEIFLGLNTKARDYFDDLGEWKREEIPDDTPKSGAI